MADVDSGAALGQTAAQPQAGAHGRFVPAFRQILLWPLQMLPGDSDDEQHSHHWDLLARSGDGGPRLWSEIEDEFPDDSRDFQERHYREFVTFLPHMQRLLYGARAARAGSLGRGESPIRVFRRRDVAGARIVLDAGTAPIEVDVVHVDLYFFYDIDVVILAVEIAARDLSLERVQDLLHRFGRAYPVGWSNDGQALHCPHKVEWLDRAGKVLATSDYERRERFLAEVCEHQAPAIAAHWSFLLAPMTLGHLHGRGPLRYRLLEHYRMPVMAWLAVDQPLSLTRSDYVRLSLVLAPGQADSQPYAGRFLADFERRHCYDRFHDPDRSGQSWIDTRFLCSGHAMVVIGDAHQAFFTDAERGVLAQFRHQFFLLGLFAHFHRAALLMLSDRFVRIIARLDVARVETVRQFRIDVRRNLEIFLRFTHRYWFSEVSDQAVAHDLFRMWSEHLATAKLYADVREEIQDMSQYLDSDMLRRTSGTMVRLTVVAILSLVGTTTTGFLGMNLIDESGAEPQVKLLYFALVAGMATTLTVYTVMKARVLAEFLDALADDRVPWRRKLHAFLAVWRKG